MSKFHYISTGVVIVGIIIAGIFLIERHPAVAPHATPTPEANIIITSPHAGDTVSNPITVSGKARVFERTFNYRLLNDAGDVLFEGQGMTSGPDLPDYGTFTAKIPVPGNATQNLIVQVFEYSAKDGSIVNLISVPVKLSTLEAMPVNVYFNNSQFDPGASCSSVFPVPRQVIKTKEVAFIALAELFSGVTPEEKAKGYFTSVPERVQVQSISIKNDTAYVDFNSALDAGVGGSCRVSAIRAQITETLKQFSNIKQIVLSINGRTEDILQP